MAECGSFYHKCKMRPLLVRLNEERRISRSLGRLGPAQFETLERFFRRKCHHLPTQLPLKSRVVALGDVHGDLMVLLAVLYMMKVVDKSANWIGGTTVVVQCGDILDRDGRSDASVSTTSNLREEVDILQYLHALDQQAQRQGGRVVSVLGNHEASNVYMDDEYSMYMMFQTSPQVAGWGGLRKKQALFKPGGLVARWMARHMPVVLQVGKFLFVHGGYKQIQDQSPYQIAQDTSRALREGRRLPDIAKYILTDRSGTCPLDSKWDGLVVGHTVVSEVKGTCKNRVWHVDVAMSEAFGRPLRLGALEIHPNMIRTFNYSKKKLTIRNYGIDKELRDTEELHFSRT